MSTLVLNTFNTRGLGDSVKRRAVFHWLKRFYPGIILLQETHSTFSLETQWQREWGGIIKFCHGTRNSRGVAILFPQNMNIEINKVFTDADGRMIILDVNIEDKNVILGNIYAPTKDKIKDQTLFLKALSDKLQDYQDHNIIIGGDFNVCLNPELDKKGGTIENTSVYANSVVALQEELNLMDIWRVTHPECTKYTWRGRTKNGIVQSRLDFFLTSIHMIYDLNSVEIFPGIKSDHSIVTLKFKTQDEQQRGRGFWKFNASLLKDLVYIQRIKNVILESKRKYNAIENKSLLWDFIKCELRSETISYSSWISKENRAQMANLNSSLSKLEQDLNNGNQNVYNEYKEKKEQLEKLIEEKASGAYIRARAQYIEDNEKSTKYFLQLEKRNFKTKSIKCLKTESKTLTDPTQILQEQYRFYKQLYTKDDSQQCMNQCSLLNLNIPKLSAEDKNKCDDVLTMDECTSALKELPNNKSPGSDGFTSDFYKLFWSDIKCLVFNSFSYAFENGILSDDQRRAILTLLPKADKDLRLLKNWRPLSLLNTDYKILTKALSNRLQRVIPKLVSEDQVAYIKGRQLGENCRKILDVFELTSTKIDPGFALFLDFEKAFDTVSRVYLFKTLQSFNFGENFCKWMKILYTSPLCSIINNGHSSEAFETSRGFRPNNS